MFFKQCCLMIRSPKFCRNYLLIFRCSLLLLMISGESFANNRNDLGNFDTIFIAEKNKFIQAVKVMPGDTAVSYPVIRNFEAELNRTGVYVENIQSLTIIEKEKAKRSLMYFLQAVNKKIEKNQFHLFELSGALLAYQKVLRTILQHQPILPVTASITLSNCQLITAAFTQYNEASLLTDITTFKRVSASPEFILQFLEANPDFRFADSLLLEKVLHDPMSVVYYLRKADVILQSKIKRSDNTYIRLLASLSDNKYAKDLAVFIPHMEKGMIREEDILQARAEPAKYFQLLVNTFLQSRQLITPMFLQPLKNGIRDKAIGFYVNEINHLHNATDAVRFASVNGLRPEDLYFIITTCGDELYTSSFLGLYNRFIAQLTDQSIEGFFDAVQGENFNVFIRLAANYNVLDHFLDKFSPEKKVELLRSYINNIEKDPATALEKAMDIADSFGALKGSSSASEIMYAEIANNFNRCVSEKNYLGNRLYGILNDMLPLTKSENDLQKLWSVLGNYEVLEYSTLSSLGQQITEVVLFYGDDDGVASFSNFLKNYTDKTKWVLTRNKQWISIQSLTNNQFTIYANLPLDIEQQADVGAQDSLFNYLEKNSLQPSIVIHRGHSYHLEKTLKRLTPTVKLTILGSCGGYNKAISIASINPDVQIIGSKKTGSKSINDPILNITNTLLANGKNLSWPSIWKELGEDFKKDKSLLAQFNEYFSPSQNLGLFVLKLYNGNNKVL